MSEHTDWVSEIHSILMFEWMKHRWLIFRFVLLSLWDWKPLVKMKMVAGISFDSKAWEMLLYLLVEFDARASSLDYGGPMVCVVGDVFVAYWWILSYMCVMIGVIILELEPFWWLLVAGSYFMTKLWRLYS